MEVEESRTGETSTPAEESQQWKTHCFQILDFLSLTHFSFDVVDLCSWVSKDGGFKDSK